jgi:ABC-type glutathione transport system ATPase component
MSEPVLSVRNLTRTYVTGSGGLTVLKGVDLDVMPGEIVGLIGPSGSGKSSLLHAAGLLEKPTERTSAGWTSGPGRSCACSRSASSTSSTICCRSSTPATTSPCRCASPAWARRKPAGAPRRP